MKKQCLGLAAACLMSGACPPNPGGSQFNVSFVGCWDGGASYADVWADGDYAYIGHFGNAFVEILDVSDPGRPVHVVQYALPFPNQDASAQDVKVGDGLLFIALEGSGNSVHIVDVRDPANPVPVVDIFIDGFTGIHNVFYHDGYLYLADSGSPRVGIVDLTQLDPDAPPAEPITETKWFLEDVGVSIVHDVTVVGDRLYVSAWDSGVWIYDVSDVANMPPVFLGSGPGDNTHSCWPTGDGRYVISGEERSGGGIIVYRITERAGPSVTLEVTDAAVLPLSEASSVHNQVTIGYRVYNSWYGAGLRVYDVDPQTGTLTYVAGYDPGQASAWGVYPFLGPDRVLVSDIGNGLIVLEVDTPIPGDVDGSGAVDVVDLLLVLGAWGPCAGCPEDLNGDDTVGIGDLLMLLAGWG